MSNALYKREIIDSLPEDFKYDWGVEAINAHKVWDKTKGEGVKIAVIDTGLDLNHPDFSNSFKNGINMFQQNNNIFDEFGHGTMVAGLIAGAKTGVAPNSDLYIAKVLDDKGQGSMANVMNGITFAMNYEVDILCMSLGTTRRLPLILEERITQAYNKGVTIVCATGNRGQRTPEHPSILDEVIAVGGVDKNLKRAFFSNTGKQLDVVAPSVEILSTYKDGKYCRMTGTSMASPLVAGGIALLMSYYKKKGVKLSPKQVKEILMSLGEHSYESGYGFFDIEYLINLAD